MLNSKLYDACINAQQRMIGMMDIGLPNTFYTNLTDELESFVSSFIQGDRYGIAHCYKILSGEKFEYLTDLGVAEDIPDGWDKAMRQMFSHIADTMIGLGIPQTEYHKFAKYYSDLTAVEWISIVLEYTDYALTHDLL